MVHRGYVVYYLINITRGVRVEYFGFRFEQVVDRCLRSLDLAREYCFFPDVHEYK